MNHTYTFKNWYLNLNNILFIYKGNNEWQGTKDDIMSNTNEKLNDLVFASDLFRKVKKAEMAEEKE